MTGERRYWLALFSQATWRQFQASGSRVTGFRQRRWASVRKIKVGDYLLCYMTGLSRFIAALVVTAEPYWDETPLCDEEVFPARVPVKPILSLEPESAVPIAELRDQLSLFDNLSHPNAWTARIRQSPGRWDTDDAELVMEALLDAQVNPVVREIDTHRSSSTRSRTGLSGLSIAMTESETQPINISGFHEPSSHTEIQWLLLKLGSDLGLNVWVARNDRNRSYAGSSFTKIERLLAQLPRQFDSPTQQIIEHIDVLWLQSNAIVAAFEVESTTTIYSGLLRMADLVAMQPNLNIPLYLVAPDRRRAKVIAEINRPAFSRCSPPMRKICRFIAFSRLRAKLREVAPAMRYLRPEFIEEIAESCADRI